MILSNPIDKTLLTELLAVLDEEISLLNRKGDELETLSNTIVERDEERMQQLLVQMEQTHQAQAAADVRLDALRNTIAPRIGCDPREMKLSCLIEQLGEPDRLTVEYRREQIILLSERLREQYMATAMLLAESQRINRILLEGILSQGPTVNTYSAAGSDSWHPGGTLLNTER